MNEVLFILAALANIGAFLLQCVEHKQNQDGDRRGDGTEGKRSL